MLSFDNTGTYAYLACATADRSGANVFAYTVGNNGQLNLYSAQPSLSVPELLNTQPGQPSALIDAINNLYYSNNSNGIVEYSIDSLGKLTQIISAPNNASGTLMMDPVSGIPMISNGTTLSPVLGSSGVLNTTSPAQWLSLGSKYTTLGQLPEINAQTNTSGQMVFAH